VTHATDRILIGDNAVASLDGRVLLDVEGPLSIAYTGVAKFQGGVAQAFANALAVPPVRSLGSGSAYISMRTECERPKYRWMVENQLFAYGRVKIEGTKEGCLLKFSYDVYAAG
jgi:hypothetical protein